MRLTLPGYYHIRGYLRRQRALRPLLAQTRNLVLAGPLRPALVAYHRTMARPTPIKTNTLPYVKPFPIELVVRSLDEHGFAAGVSVTPACVNKLLKCYETKLVQNYLNPHQDHDFIAQLVANERLVTVARRYLDAEPVLLETRLHWYKPGTSGNPTYFHYDVGDVLSVTFFVFLTDVDDHQSVTHKVVAGTHRHKTLKELWTRYLEEDQAQARYPGRVHTSMGKRGTAWFEDTLAFHKHGYVGKFRQAFSVQYSIHRQG
jgi:hypothetical protein